MMSSVSKDGAGDDSRGSPPGKKRKIDKDEDSVKDAEQNPNREDPEDDKKEEGGLEKDTEDGELSNSVLSGLHDKVGRLDTQDTFSMLEWKDGVGTLPGSDIRFRKTEFGTLEIITGDSDVENNGDKKDGNSEEENGSKDEESKEVKSPGDKNGGNEDDDEDESKSSHDQDSEDNTTTKSKRKYVKKKRKKKSDDLLKCEVCGCYGLRSEFCSSGRFCSQRCVGAYASKCRAEALAATASAEVIDSHSHKKKKKKVKKLSMKGMSSNGFGGKSFGRESGDDRNISPRPLNGSADKKKKAQLSTTDDASFFYSAVGFSQEFEWDLYLSITGTTAVPLQVFEQENPCLAVFPKPTTEFQQGLKPLFSAVDPKHPSCFVLFKNVENPCLAVFPKPATEFQQGMKLEAVDPKHPSCFCVVSVVEVQGARLRLHFDGWSESYDFWTNADSPFLFPPGWCKKNGQILNPPRGIAAEDFDWETYLLNVRSEAAPESLFRETDVKMKDTVCEYSTDKFNEIYTNLHLLSKSVGEIPESTHGFTTDMKLEAVDKKNPDLTCVASVTNVIGEYFLIHFDEWDDTYDYWCRPDCPFLHPAGWCKESGIRLTPPQDDQVDSFDWEEYLAQTKSKAVPLELLQEHRPPSYPVGNKLEVVDPRNPSLIRVASVSEVDDCQVKIHFDGWDEMYDLWFDGDSTDLHPVGYCHKTGHALEAPPSSQDAEDTTLCPTPGCRGIGHVKGAKYTTHHSIFGCPYSPHNVQRGSPLVDRLAGNSMGEEPSIASRVYGKQPKDVTTPENEGPSESPPSTKSEMIKQQKLLKRVIGRPAKKSHEKLSAKTARLMGRPITKFEMKEKSKKLLKRRFSSPGDQRVSMSPVKKEVAHRFSPPAAVPMSSLGNRGMMPTHMPRVKILQQQQQLIRQQNNRIFGWTIEDVFEFIRSIGLPDHANRFQEQQIDGQALLLMSQADMIHHLRIKLGPALKISHAVSKL